MRINLFAGPCVGKSVTASKIFAELKIKGYQVELVTEVIKNWAYIGRKTKSFDQLFIFGSQLHSEDLIFQHGLHSITDSPILMQPVYAKKYNFPAYQELIEIALKYEKVNPSLNIFLDRKNIPYQNIGRYENYEEAIEMDKQILKIMDEYLKYDVFDSQDFNGILSFVEMNLR